MERIELLENGLLGLMKTLGMPKTRIMISILVINQLHLHMKMAAWIASYHDSEDTITLQSFTAKLNELIAEAQGEAK